MAHKLTKLCKKWWAWGTGAEVVQGITGAENLKDESHLMK